ncbi:MAG: hypothetical protein C0483_11715 [Pirellula sp.]|nr:hypothetical protein [Pirellula sp.]
MLVGPVFTRELSILPRRGRLFVARGAYVGGLAALWITAWQVLAGTQIVRNVGDFAYFGSTVFQVLAPLHLMAAMFFAALSTAAAVAHEKDRRTFDLLLLTNLTNRELVLGRLFASLLSVVDFTIAAAPLFALSALCGGVDFRQISAVFVVTLAGVTTAGSLGSTIALWRERTFQTLATTVLVLVAWTGLWEAVDRGLFGNIIAGTDARGWAAAASPWHAAISCTRPFDDLRIALGQFLMMPWQASLLSSLVLAALLNAIAVWRVRVWNPSRELFQAPTAPAQPAKSGDLPHAWSLRALQSDAAATGPELVKANDAIAGRGLRASRNVWDNPVLWREIMTWAYGRKVLFVRLFYAALVAALAWGALQTADNSRTSALDWVLIAAPAAVLGALLINMQAVSAITSERDANALDLLLVTDLTSKEFVFGKLAGVFFNAKEMLLLPLVLLALLWQIGAANGESTLYIAIGWLSLSAFAAVLGIHVGMHYANSRQAAAVSLATVFFLIVGVGVSMRIMTAFSGSFQAQLQPFLATIVGGGVGLYAALGRRNPSPAITLGSFILPLATFYALTSFLIGAGLAATLAVVGAYSFTTAALLIPAIFEFDVATGRTSGGEERDG